MSFLIIDTDPGNGIPGSDVDDALAIALGLAAPGVTLLGVTTVAGNVPLDDATACALQLLEVADREDVPVHPGLPTPLVADPRPLREALDSRRTSELVARLWRDVPRPAPRRREPGSAARFLVDSIMERPGQVTLVAIGPLTNVATALRLEPRLASTVQRIVIMGGSVRMPSLMTPVTELNACYDPEATAIVLNSGAPLTMVGLDVTTRTSFTPADLERLRAIGTPLARYLASIAEAWLQYVIERRRLPGFWLHDPLAVCVALDPTIVRTEPMYVEVELASPRFRGQTVGWSQNAPYVIPGGAPNVDVCLDVDNERFMSLFWQILERTGDA